MITSYLVDIGSYKVIKFVQDSVDNFNQQMALLILCREKFSSKEPLLNFPQSKFYPPPVLVVVFALLQISDLGSPTTDLVWGT